MEQNSLEKKSTQEKLTVKIEIAKPEDWKMCKDLRLRAMNGEDGYMFGITPQNKKEKIAVLENAGEEIWKEEMCSTNKFAVLGWAGTEAIGIGSAKKRQEKEDWYLYSGYVDKDFRGGVGKKIFAKRLDEIRHRGGKKVTLGVKAINDLSIHIAVSFGFEKVEEGSDEEGFFMQLKDVNNPEVIKKINEVLNEG